MGISAIENHKLVVPQSTLALTQDIYDEARRYFSLIDYYKVKDNAVGYNGYRARGIEYSQSKDRPDQNESFSAQRGEYDPTYHAKTLHGLLMRMLEKLEDAASNWLKGLVVVSDDEIPLFTNSSWIQVNHYRPEEGDTPFLQEKHDDGHLLTLVHSNAPGLEMFVEGYHGKPTEVPAAADAFYAMYGDTTRLMSGGKIEATYHQVRRHKEWKYRQSLTYFVNLDPGQKIKPWVENSINKDVDILAESLKFPTNHGLPTLA